MTAHRHSYHSKTTAGYRPGAYAGVYSGVYTGAKVGGYKTPDFTGPTQLVLKISMQAHIKLQIMRDAVNTETSALCVCSEDDPLYVEDVHPIKCKSASAAFVDQDEDYFNELQKKLRVEQGIKRRQTGFIWIHTHPGGPTPSGTDWGQLSDEEHMIMLILGKDNNYSCHLKRNTKVGCKEYTEVAELKVRIDTENLKSITLDVEELRAETKRLTAGDRKVVAGKSTTHIGFPITESDDDWAGAWEYTADEIFDMAKRECVDWIQAMMDPTDPLDEPKGMTTQEISDHLTDPVWLSQKFRLTSLWRDLREQIQSGGAATGAMWNALGQGVMAGCRQHGMVKGDV